MSIFVPFRITQNDQYSLEEFNQFFINHTTLHAIFEISSEGVPHWHGYSHGIVSKSSVVNWIKTELHCVGNKDYSMSSKDLPKQDRTENGYYRYMCKGTVSKKPQKYINLDPKWIEENWLQYWIVNEEIIRLKKQGKQSQMKSVVEFVKLNQPYENDTAIVRRILQYFYEADKMVSNSQVENYFLYVRSVLHEGYMDTRASALTSLWSHRMSY